MAADLHVHSTYSDGCLSPQELVSLAGQFAVGAFALTDHDTIQGLEEAFLWAAKSNVVVIPGVELSCRHGDSEYHILGYHIDPLSGHLQQQLSNLKGARLERIEQMVHKLRQQGLGISWDRVLQIADRGVVGRPHIAEALVESGYASHKNAAFDLFLMPDCPAFVPRKGLSVSAGIELLRLAGGVPVWAHPGGAFSQERLREFKALGLMGVEVWHPDHSSAQMQWFADKAAEIGLLVTGGSDFHCHEAGAPTFAMHRTPAWALEALAAAAR